MYIVSACLLGANCKYNGGNNDSEAVKDFCEGHKVFAVCPETAGGLKSPRPPAEQVISSCGGERCDIRSDDSGETCGGEHCEVRVVDKNGEDLTEYFKRGAEICLEKVMAACGAPDQDDSEEPELAILKANSPSCGCGRIYDGTFSGKLIDGDGLFAKMLKEQGIKIITEEDIEKRQRG